MKQTYLSLSVIFLFLGCVFCMLSQVLATICFIASVYFVSKYEKELKREKKEKSNEK